MKLATFRAEGGRQAIGIVDSARGLIVDIALAAPDNPAFADMQSLIDAGPRALDQVRSIEARAEQIGQLALSEIELLAPVPRPIQMRDAMTFPLHIRQSLRGLSALKAATEDEREHILRSDLPDLPDIYRATPVWYFTNHLCVAGPNRPIDWPRYSKMRDFELELGIFTWRSAANISESEAPDHIFGYTIFNDFSARDQQSIEMPGMLGPGKGKSFNGSNVLGPWIVTPDEIGSPYDLRTCAAVNGQAWTEGNTGGMLYSFEELIAALSRDETICAGEFIGSGTVENGCGLEMNRFLEKGDEIALEIERIGTLNCSVSRL